MEWLERLQAPGLILAGAVICMGYKLYSRQLDIIHKLSKQSTEHGLILREIATQVQILCRKRMAGDPE